MTLLETTEQLLFVISKGIVSIWLKKNLTAILEKEDDGYVSSCPELDIASQGYTIEEAKGNLKEAVELFFKNASESEILERVHNEVYISNMEVMVG